MRESESENGNANEQQATKLKKTRELSARFDIHRMVSTLISRVAPGLKVMMRERGLTTEKLDQFDNLELIYNNSSGSVRSYLVEFGE